MSFTKPFIVLALTTVLTACATTHEAIPGAQTAKTDSNTATIKLVTAFENKTNAPGGFSAGTAPYYMICESECDRAKFSTEHNLKGLLNFFPYKSNETKETRVTANAPIEIIAGLRFPQSIYKSDGVRPHRPSCTQRLEFIPEAGKSYNVTLFKGDKHTCSFTLTEA